MLERQKLKFETGKDTTLSAEIGAEYFQLFTKGKAAVAVDGQLLVEKTDMNLPMGSAIVVLPSVSGG